MANSRENKNDPDASEELVRVPYHLKKNYDEDFVKERRDWLGRQVEVKFSHIDKYSFHPKDAQGNIENFVGVAQVPIGVMGPLKINGGFAKGTFYVPMATTEGALVETYQRGAIAITKSGGANTTILKDENYLDPVFVLKNTAAVKSLINWVENHFQELKQKVKETTRHGVLNRITPYVIGRRVILKFSYFTHDAMGANMINFATDKICEFIAKQVPIEKYLLRSNMSAEKKAAAVNLLFNYGKEVSVDVTLPRKIVTRYLNSSPEAISQAWHSWALGSIHAGMYGINAQFANGLAALYIACGQDVAHIVNGSVGINMLEMTEDGNLYASLKLPNILVGTVGGGTALGTQKECLEMIDCYGKEKSKKFAEIVAAVLLSGELGICAGITSGEFQKPHIRASRHTKEKAYSEQT